MVQISADLYSLKEQLNAHGFDVKMRDHEGKLHITVTDPSDNRRIDAEYSHTRDADDIFLEFHTQLERVYNWNEQSSRRAKFMVESARRQSDWAAQRADDPFWRGALDRAKAKADDEFKNYSGRVELIVLDQKRATEMLWEHNEATMKRGLAQDPSVISILNGEHLINQRKQSRTHKNRLAAEIGDGNWYATHQGIAVAADGYLFDGQHRVETVATSGLPIATWVTWDANEATFPVIDTGKRRTAGDVLYMTAGVANANQVASVIRLLDDYDTTRDHTKWYNKQLSNEQIRKLLVNEYKVGPVGDAFKIAQTVCTHANVHLSRVAVAAVTFVALRAWPDGPIREFWNSSKGKTPDRYYLDKYAVTDLDRHPAATLQSWGAAWGARVSNEKRQSKGQKNTEHFVIALKAWNDACVGNTISKYNFDTRWLAPDPYVPKHLQS
jgi:hypothetical protein